MSCETHGPDLMSNRQRSRSQATKCLEMCHTFQQRPYELKKLGKLKSAMSDKHSKAKCQKSRSYKVNTPLSVYVCHQGL